VCWRCGDGLTWADSGSYTGSNSGLGACRACRLAPPGFVRAVSYGPYEGRMRDAIHALKYDRLLGAARRLGSLLAQAIAQLDVEAPAEMLVVPVPLHRSKYTQRGFNQARLLAVHALAALRRTHSQWKLRLASSTVMRLAATESQAGLTPHQRRQNVRGAFLVPDPGAVMAKNVLVIDDILTTGATARSVAQVLLRAGAANVWVATLARARRAYDYPRNSDQVYSERELPREAREGLAAEDPAAGLEPISVHATPDQPSF